MNKQFRNIFIILFLLINVGCDQITKVIVRHNVQYNEQISLIDNVVTLTKAENTGAFLSLGDKLPRGVYRFVMIAIPLLVLIYALYYLLKSTELNKLMMTGLCLIVGGGFGNIIDRILFGSVTDFLYFNFGLFHTGIVNMADISLTTGFFILLYELMIKKKTI
jgi:signal peptidase II